jgi:hypothetical protein
MQVESSSTSSLLLCWGIPAADRCVHATSFKATGSQSPSSLQLVAHATMCKQQACSSAIAQQYDYKLTQLIIVSAAAAVAVLHATMQTCSGASAQQSVYKLLQLNLVSAAAAAAVLQP